jgi:hypothetical protein
LVSSSKVATVPRSTTVASDGCRTRIRGGFDDGRGWPQTLPPSIAYESGNTDIADAHTSAGPFTDAIYALRERTGPGAVISMVAAEGVVVGAGATAPQGHGH